MECTSFNPHDSQENSTSFTPEHPWLCKTLDFIISDLNVVFVFSSKKTFAFCPQAGHSPLSNFSTLEVLLFKYKRTEKIVIKNSISKKSIAI